jgi:hypothetical protein
MNIAKTPSRRKNDAKIVDTNLVMEGLIIAKQTDMKLLHKLLLKLGYRPTRWTDELGDGLSWMYYQSKIRNGQDIARTIDNTFRVTLSVKKIKK